MENDGGKNRNGAYWWVHIHWNRNFGGTWMKWAIMIIIIIGQKKKLQEKECNDSYLHDEIGGDPIESTNK